MMDKFVPPYKLVMVHERRKIKKTIMNIRKIVLLLSIARLIINYL